MLFAPISKFEVEIARKEFVLLRKMIRGLLDDQPVGRRLRLYGWNRFLLFKLRINHFDKPFRGIVSYQKPLTAWGITDFSSTYTDWQFPKEFEQRFQETEK